MKDLHIILFLLILAIATPAYSQKTKGKSKQQLQNEISSLQKEISNANQLLKQTKKDREMTLNEVSILDKKIKQREKLIKAYNEQIAVLDEEINTGQSNIRSLNSDLAGLQKEYAKMVVFANKTAAIMIVSVLSSPQKTLTKPSADYAISANSTTQEQPR